MSEPAPNDQPSPHDLPTIIQRDGRPSSSIFHRSPNEHTHAEGGTRTAGGFPLPLSRLGEYEVLQEVGRGGMGVVFKARHVRLNRTVALKMLPGGLLARQDDLQRFETEAAAAAQLQHPNIVALFEAGTLEGQPYFSMEYVSGSSLAQRLELGVLPGRLAASYLERVARAAHYAHQKGIIHRDLKPGNILLDDLDQPKITDFGLAKLVQRDSGQTRTGTVLGTPSYMAPEQANARKDVGPPCDIYALGAILYELLTGRPPFVGETALATLQMVAQQEPVHPRLHNPRIDRDLETICLKCLEKDPSRRYASAEALAEDLRRYLTGEPISARRLSLVGRAVKWCRRKPALAALVVVCSLSLIAFAGLQYHAAEVERERRVEAERLESVASVRAEAMRHLVYLSEMRQSYDAWQSANLTRADQLLQAWVPTSNLKDLRDWEWRYLRGLCGTRFTLPGHPERANAVAFSSDGQRLASAGGPAAKPGEVKVWDAATGKLLLTLPQKHSNAIDTVAFSPNGLRLATGSADRTVRLWDATTGAEVAVLKGHSDYVSSVCFTADGKGLFSAGGDGRVILWDLTPLHAGAQPRRRYVLSAHAGGVSSVACSSDGKLVATGGVDETVRLWDAETGTLRHTLRGHEGEVMSVCFNPSGKMLVSGGGPGLRRGQVRLWDADTGNLLRGHHGLSDRVLSVAVSRVGQVAAAGSDGLLHLWDERRSSEPQRLRGDTQLVYALTFNPDGKRLASAGSDGRVRLWNSSGGQETLRLVGPIRVESLAFSSDSKQLAAAGRGTTRDDPIRLWKLPGGTEQAKLPGHVGQARTLALSGDGKYLASGGDDRLVLLHTFGSDRPPRELNGHTGRVTTVAFAPGPETSLLASAGEDDVIRLWDIKTGQQLRELKGHRNGILTLAFSPDGKHLASGSYDRTVRVWDLSSGDAAVLEGHAGSVNSVAFSPDGKQVASGSSDQTVRIWDWPSKKEFLKLEGSTRPVYAVAYHPQGKRLASVGADRLVRLWDLVTRREILALEGTGGTLRSVAFSPDGKYLASGGDFTAISVWSAE